MTKHDDKARVAEELIDLGSVAVETRGINGQTFQDLPPQVGTYDAMSLAAD